MGPILGGALAVILYTLADVVDIKEVEKVHTTKQSQGICFYFHLIRNLISKWGQFIQLYLIFVCYNTTFVQID